MGHVKSSVITFLCFCEMVAGRDTLTVGPCDVRIKAMSLNCSQRGLKEIPTEIWINVTTLDLSQNLLNLTSPKRLAAIHKFQEVLQLNLSGNYLPLLDRDMLGTFPSLRLLDLSRCQLRDIKPNAFQGSLKLKSLLLQNNEIRDFQPSVLRNLKQLSFLDLHGNPFLRNVAPDWLKAEQEVAASVNETGELTEEDLAKKNLRRLLTESPRLLDNSLNETQDKIPEADHAPSWPYLLGALGTILAIALFIVLLVKCKLFQQYLDSYRHALLSEADSASQCDPASLRGGFSGHNMNSRALGFEDANELDDDDGFIEDNYIQASERERAEREEEEKESDLEDDIQISIN